MDTEYLIKKVRMEKIFGQYLKELRLSFKPKKLSQKELGDSINSTRQYIDAIEAGRGSVRAPRYEHLKKLIDLLNLNEKQSEKFLRLAFKERIKGNWDLYIHLHKEFSIE